MTVKVVQGDMFKGVYEAIVNPVNCVGVMGKGVAKIVKEKFPKVFKGYSSLCYWDLIYPGQTYIYSTGINNPKYILNTATKDHWKDSCNLETISSCYKTIVNTVRDEHIKSVAIPALGCGCGGLDWNIVKPIAMSIIQSSNLSSDVVIDLYEPYN